MTFNLLLKSSPSTSSFLRHKDVQGQKALGKVGSGSHGSAATRVIFVQRGNVTIYPGSIYNPQTVHPDTQRPFFNYYSLPASHFLSFQPPMFSVCAVCLGYAVLSYTAISSWPRKLKLYSGRPQTLFPFVFLLWKRRLIQSLIPKLSQGKF